MEMDDGKSVLLQLIVPQWLARQVTSSLDFKAVIHGTSSYKLETPSEYDNIAYVKVRDVKILMSITS